MGIDDSLTNEKLVSRFENSFALVSHAIALAKTVIARGEEWDENPANLVLASIAEGRDLFAEEEPVVEEVSTEEVVESTSE